MWIRNSFSFGTRRRQGNWIWNLIGMSRKAGYLNSTKLNKLRGALLAWYDQNRRSLPWRKDRDPYRVWVSEIMLQQTRVAAVLEHYQRFLRRFPKVQTLAAARESSVLSVWSGLGYYHRARRMRQAAKVIVSERSGEFPRTAEEWRKLPGIGRYTAAAIASIAFGAAAAVVDGNVERVLERVFGRSEVREGTWLRAETLLDRERPGDFNQAMMELGATLCVPRAPHCPRCPLNRWCHSKGAKATRPQPVRKRKDLYYGLAQRNGAVLLVRRPAKESLMAGMWELPSIPVSQRNGNVIVATLRHSITNTDYHVVVIAVAPDTLRSLETEARWLAPKQWESLPLTGLARKVLRRLATESGVNSAESKTLV
jgi:A/G-specific adenine glycosylase